MSEKRKLQIDRDCAYLERDGIIKLFFIGVGIFISTSLFLYHLLDIQYIYIVISAVTYTLLNTRNFKRVYDLNKEILEIDNKIKELDYEWY